MSTDTDTLITRDNERVARIAIADPPYLGRAALWYGGKGRSKQGTHGRAKGRPLDHPVEVAHG